MGQGSLFVACAYKQGQGAFAALLVFIKKQQAAQARRNARHNDAGQGSQGACQCFGLRKVEGARGAHAHSAGIGRG